MSLTEDYIRKRDAAFEEAKRRASILVNCPAMSRKGRRPSAILVRAIVHEEAQRGGVSSKDIMGQSRWKKVAIPRWRVFTRLRALGFSLPGIGMAMGGKDHTTVRSGIIRLREIEANAQPLNNAQIN